jgi:hypothetical protein
VSETDRGTGEAETEDAADNPERGDSADELKRGDSTSDIGTENSTDDDGSEDSTNNTSAASSRGDNRGAYGILAGLAINVSLALVTMFGFEGVAAAPEFFVLWAAGNFLILPAGLYLDALYLRDTSDWTGSPLIWGAMAAIPAVNIAVAAFYLSIRGSTDPLVSRVES